MNFTAGGVVHGPFIAIQVLGDRLRADGVDFPFAVIGAYEISQDDGQVPPPFFDLPGARATLVAKIDQEVDSIYAAVIGNRGAEYTAALEEATAFADGGYAGDPPPSVASWAAAKSWTSTQAADDILAAAASLAGLRDMIRAQRLAKKEAARGALTKTSLATVAAQWAGALAAIRAAAGV